MGSELIPPKVGAGRAEGPPVAPLVFGFDLDLTLVDLRASTELALREVNRLGLGQVDIDAVMADLGVPFRDQLSPYFARNDLETALRAFAAATREQGASHIVAMPGARESVDGIRARGDDIIVVTGRRLSTVRRSLAASGLPQLAAVGQLFGTDKSPVLTAHRACLFAGDHPLDMSGAAAAGVLALGIASGSHSREQLLAAGAEVVLDALTDFPDWYDEHRGELTPDRADPRLRAGATRTVSEGLMHSGRPEYWAVAEPGRPAVVDGATTMTYAEWDDRADRLAESLSRLPGDRRSVITHLHQSLDWFVINLAVNKLGWEQISLNWRLTPYEVEAIVRDSSPSALFVDDPSIEQWLPPALGLATPVVSLRADHPDAILLADLMHGERVARNSRDASSLVLYSSGTTGRPRGIRKEAYRDAKHLQQILEYSDSLRRPTRERGPNRTLLTMPLHHGAGPKSARYCHDLGGSVYLLDRFDAEEVLRLIEAHRITHWKTVPTMLNRLRALTDEVLGRYDMSSIEAVSVGSASSSPALKRWALSFFGEDHVHEGYGASEVGMVTVMRPKMMGRKLASCGRPRKHVRIRITDDAGHEQPGGTPGRVTVRTPSTIAEYVDDAGRAIRGADGFVDTGDVGYVDEDGYLYLTGRSKDMMICGGVNIYPAEIEQAIGELPEILEVAVVGVPDPDMGERIVAYCELRPAHEVPPAAIVDHLKTRLATYKHPREIYFVPELPRNAMEKILKTELRAQYVARTAE